MAFYLFLRIEISAFGVNADIDKASSECLLIAISGHNDPSCGEGKMPSYGVMLNEKGPG